MNLIVAVDNNWGIGKDGELLDRFKEDTAFFREMTKGKVIIMGRGTLESLPGGKPLSNRENIVLTRNKKIKCDGVTVFNNMEDAILYAKSKYKSEDIFFVGGAEVYNECEKYCDTAYITKFNYAYNADKYILNFDKLLNWEVGSDKEVKTEKGRVINFVKYIKKIC